MPEVLGDLFVGLSGSKSEQDLMLSVREACGQLARHLHHAVSCGGQHGVDRLRAQTAGARVAEQLGFGGGSVECRSVRAPLSHCPVGVIDREILLPDDPAAVCRRDLVDLSVHQCGQMWSRPGR
jgi:hypothetical protein